MKNRDMGFFMNSEVESHFEEVEIEGISKFRYPQEHELAGEKIPWIIIPLTTAQIKDIRRRNTKVSIKRHNKVSVTDTERVAVDIMVDSIAYPNFKDASWLEATKLIDPADLLQKVLDNPGEFERISQEVVVANGFGSSDSEDELVTEAKN